MQYSTAELIRLIGEGKAGAPEPGDIYIVNDPYLGGTHLMDVRFALPFYYRGEHYCWLQNTGHWPDIGGMVPGGFSSKATEVEQEGLRLPPVKLFKRGVMDAEIFCHPELQHAHRRPAHRRHQGPGGGAEGRRAAPDRADGPLRPGRGHRRRRPRSAAARRG